MPDAGQRRSTARRLVAVFDPAEPGFVRRVARIGAVVVLAGACAVAAVAAPWLRSPSGRYMQAVLLLQVRAYGATARVARDLIDDYPGTNGAYYSILATAHRRAGDHEAQLAVYDEAAAAMPNHWRTQSERCWYGSIFGRATEVMGSCDAAVTLAPAAASWAHLRRGAARAIAGDTDGAVADLTEGLARWNASARPGDRLRQPWAEWLAELQAGRQAFDEATLRRERARF